ncbi:MULTISPECIES: HEAT repeat domain-containing protein [unclassified Streptomyces]|uniref:HEAT repeat domain-containing protein n=1 Tax=unclassified Streptomyces TaxID=2593676 RepID=UPI0033E5D278
MERASSIAELMDLRMAGDVTALCAATRSQDHQVAVYAIAMLGSATPTPEVTSALDLCIRQDRPPHGVRWNAVRSLGRLRAPHAVPVLLRVLTDPDDPHEQLAKPAAKALVAIGGSDVVRGLVALCGRLATSRGHWTTLVLDALAELRAAQAVPPLLAALWEYLPDRAHHVVRTLGAIGDPRAASALLVLAHSSASPTHLRRTALTALHALPAAAWPPPHPWPSAEQLLHAPQRDPDPETARLATELLARTEEGRDHLWSVLRPAAGSADPEHPPHAVAAACAHIAAEPELFATDDRDGHIAALRHHLRASPAPPVRRAAAGALAACAGTEAAGPLLAALGDRHISDAVADLVATMPVPPPETVGLLTRPDGSAVQRAGAARALGLAECHEAAPALLSVLAQDSAPVTVRAAAADALGALRHAEAAATLAALASDEDTPGTLRAHAVRALGAIGAPHTLAVVLVCARSPHEAVRARAVTALGAFPVPESAHSLGGFVTPHAEPFLARAALRALSRIGPPALPTLVALADGPVDDLGDDLGAQLVAALAARPEAEATAALSRLAATPPQPPRIRYAAPLGGPPATDRPAREAAALVLVERGTAECLTPLVTLLAPGSWSGAHEPAVTALLRIGTAETHEHVLAFCRRSTHFYPWRVHALDVIAEAHGVRLGPQK